jgi:hypothetical protein
MSLRNIHLVRLLICLVFASSAIGSQASAQPSEIIPFTFEYGQRDELRSLSSEDVAREIARLELAYRQLGCRAATALIEKKEDSKIHKEFIELRRQASELQRRILNSRNNYTIKDRLEIEHDLRTSNELFTVEFQPAQNPFIIAFLPGALSRPNSSTNGILGSGLLSFGGGLGLMYAALPPGIGPTVAGSALGLLVGGAAIARIPRAIYKAYRYITEMDPVMEQTYRQLHDLGNASQKFWKVLHTSALVPTPWQAGASFESSKDYFQFESAYLQSLVQEGRDALKGACARLVQRIDP